MLGFYKDSALTRRVTLASPKLFLLGLDGGSKASSLWIADPYNAIVKTQASVGATSIVLDQTYDFPTFGRAVVNGQTISFTGKTTTSLTGIPASGTGSITSTIAVDSSVYPKLVYISDGNIRVLPVGTDLSQGVSIQLKRSDQGSFNFPNTGVQYVVDRVATEPGGSIQMDIQANVASGEQREFVDTSLAGINFQVAENLLQQSESFTVSPWDVVSTSDVGYVPVVTADFVAGPVVGTLADRIVFPDTSGNKSSRIYQQYQVSQVVTGQALTNSIWIKADAPASLRFEVRRGGGFLSDGSITISVTTSWQRFSVTASDMNSTLSGTGYRFYLYALNQSSIITAYIYGAQANRGSAPLTYFQTTTDAQVGIVGSNNVSLEAPVSVFRRDQGLPQAMRLFPVTREINSSLPGFIVGEYRWRDDDQLNAQELLPTQWDPDVDAIGREKFLSGIGHGDDLEPVALEEFEDSLHLRIKNGAYFSGPERFYLPANHELEFFNVGDENALSFTLASKPRPTKPIYVGTWKLDSQGFYDKEIDYRYRSEGTFDVTEDADPYQFTLDRSSNTLDINTGPARTVLYLGTLTGNATDYFDLPSYPVDRVNLVYVDRGLAGVRSYALAYTFDREMGTLVVTNPSGSGPSIPGSLTGEAVFAEVDHAIAVLYEKDIEDDRLLTEVDLNPAFSGLSGGHVYLQHRRQKPDTIQLSADKPAIQIPPTHDTVVGLTAYGPVYFENDYALLIAKTFSKVPGEITPGARMQVVVGNGFTGLINYRDPLTETIEVVTGGDGIANLLYTPQSGFGVWIPKITAVTPLTNSSLGGTLSTNKLVLPLGVPISQIRNDKEGYLVTAYVVYNNNPLFGLQGGSTVNGEIPFTTSGTPGSSAYKTNGMRDAWRSGVSLVRPTRAEDINGNNYDEVGFNGTVKVLVFGSSVPTGSTIGAYFVSYIQRVTIQLQAVESNVISNAVLLQMDVPSVIVENPWLVLDSDVQGRLNQYRLGWVRSTLAQDGPTR
jgi:hypothetical protein